MNKTEIFEKLKSILVYHLGVADDSVTMEALLVDDLGVDPLITMPIAMAIEDAFNFEIPDEVVDSVDDVVSVKDVMNYIIESMK
ncbi:MAG: acyl carrier protein [Erysipelotrichaceae bacterium]|nr:acyl carrier protein [Erysipelotrichaceae bacterium]